MIFPLFEDTKGITRRYKSNKNKQHNYLLFSHSQILQCATSYFIQDGWQSGGSGWHSFPISNTKYFYNRVLILIYIFCICIYIFGRLKRNIVDFIEYRMYVCLSKGFAEITSNIAIYVQRISTTIFLKKIPHRWCNG